MIRRLETDLQVICEPSYIKMQCPYCHEDIEVNYDEFARSMSSPWWIDWEGESISCGRCDEMFEIYRVHRE